MFVLSHDVMVLGRSPDADIVLVDDGISRRHAQVIREGDRFRVSDLGSTNGIYINGDKNDRYLLEDGDRLGIGSSTVLKFSLQDALEENFQRRMYDSAVRDALTGVHNKRYFADCLATEFAFHRRHQRELSVIMLDIDHFKRINDTHGHVCGDHVLKELAGLANRLLRSEDTLCRYGGEEFGGILRATGADKALQVAERVRKAIAKAVFTHEGIRVPVTLSIGIATFTGANFANEADLLRTADKYLYAAKEAGRNRTACAPLKGVTGRAKG